MLYDVFISHASEDKEPFVRELANKLKENRVEVWYDEFSLKVGNSLRRSIDLGLSKSRYGIVVLSPHFFKRQWANWELDGLVARQNAHESELILPIWYNVGRSEILEYSPSLADKVAIQASVGIVQVVDKILEVINPEGSTLVEARDFLTKAGYTPPVVTDDWWLDIVEYSGKEWGGMEYLAFPIPWKGDAPKARGEYIARHALQKMWQEEGEEGWLSQLTPPSEVLDFIETQPGLKDACFNDPQDVALYFPQLTMKGFGGYLEEKFEGMLNLKRERAHNSCAERIALRHPSFGGYDPGSLACNYFTGDGGGIGPSTRRYDMIDCVIWLLSSKSEWLPTKIRKMLLKGMKEWGVWEWSLSSDSGFEKNEYSNKLHLELIRSKNKDFTPSIDALKDIETRFAHSVRILEMREPVRHLVKKFLDYGFVEEKLASYKTINDKLNG